MVGKRATNQERTEQMLCRHSHVGESSLIKILDPRLRWGDEYFSESPTFGFRPFYENP
jgi:hypothetical protein